MQKARRHRLRGSDRLQAHGFRNYFTLLIGVLFTFPSQYSFTIGLTGVFSLTGWSRQIRAELHVFRVTQDTTTSRHASNTGLSPSMIVLSRTFFSQSKYDNVVLQPLLSVATKQVWAPPRSLATTRGIIIYFLFLKVLRCFSSLRSPHYFCSDNRSSTCWVVPFGNPWIKGYLHLPKAYRSLSRPSSPP